MDLHKTMDHHPRATARHLRATLHRMATRQYSAIAMKTLADICTDLKGIRLKDIHHNSPLPSQDMHTHRSNHRDHRVPVISRYQNQLRHAIYAETDDARRDRPRQVMATELLLQEDQSTVGDQVRTSSFKAYIY